MFSPCRRGRSRSSAGRESPSVSDRSRAAQRQLRRQSRLPSTGSRKPATDVPVVTTTTPPASSSHCSLLYAFTLPQTLVLHVLWEHTGRHNVSTLSGRQQSLHNLPMSSGCSSADPLSVCHSWTSWVFQVPCCNLLGSMTTLVSSRERFIGDISP